MKTNTGKEISIYYFGRTMEELIKIEKKMQAIGVRMCNGTEKKTDEAKWDELEKQAISEAESVGLFIYFQTDPRGNLIWLSEDEALDGRNYTNGFAVVNAF